MSCCVVAVGISVPAVEKGISKKKVLYGSRQRSKKETAGVFIGEGIVLVCPASVRGSCREYESQWAYGRAGKGRAGKSRA